ncbi:MAG: hypothetical protein IPG42_13180 [Betaproteobacteria bacterium]|jgi:hypothetical protein|nr:hypothetical protein [Betaproteobacteria bacterium]
MENQSTIRAEMKTRAASLPADSSLPPENLEVAPKRNRFWVGVALAVILFAVIWVIRRS